MICFTPYTLIATPRGEVPIQALKSGDKVITRDNGGQTVSWVGMRPISGRQFLTMPHLRPILIRKGCLGKNLPDRDIMVSPNQRMLVASAQTSLLFSEREVMVAAKHLINHRGIQQIDSVGVSYVQILFKNHEIILADNAWTESFQPEDYSLNGLGNSQRNEIFELFPELLQSHVPPVYHTAGQGGRKPLLRRLF